MTVAVIGFDQIVIDSIYILKYIIFYFIWILFFDIRVVFDRFLIIFTFFHALCDLVFWFFSFYILLEVAFAFFVGV